ncbi:VOC family protein [Novosphingobium sp. AP12]|uniref:VOC family protein n=1 Tax=Novosphingobium sp. AP12 TaxID=1144305 RepID=UPI000271E6DB|nr:VOC family protein [Novosphingobium sp. AP12]EJL35272.1 putative lactoylglutathione lyase [Novosphingobium sp. AP12]
MTRMLFVNLPVADVERAKAFYTGLGFVNEPRFTDETAACMVWSEAIFVMVLSHEKWKGFTDRPIPDSGSSEVMLCLACDSRAEVDAMNERAGQHGGTADVAPLSDHGFMMSRSFTDPDGHFWEAMWMDPAVASGETPMEQPA